MLKRGSEFSAEAVVIFVLGSTDAGKTSFIQLTSGDDIYVEHGLNHGESDF